MSSPLRPAVLYRRSLTPSEELVAMRRHFPVTDCMVGLEDALVIGRYSAVPFYDEVEQGLRVQRSRLVNTKAEHDYIASFAYYHDLVGHTPTTWFALSDVPKAGGPYVVKGVTNSRKHQWNTHMFAPTFADAVRIAGELANDLYLGSQDIVAREYVPLVTLEVGINGLPFANEWRIFYYGTERLSHGFYWSEAEAEGTITPEALAFADVLAARLAEHTTFFALDIAERQAGGWMVVEVNDGQMAGLSRNDPEVLFGRLRQAMDRVGHATVGAALPG